MPRPGLAGWQIEDWIYWRASDAAHPIERSPVVATVGNSSAKLFRCSMDRDDTTRLSMFATDPYMYSDSLLGNGLVGGFNGGLSQISGVPFKLTSAPNPTEKFMMVEET